MSYYLQVNKPAREAVLLTLAQAGSPEGALFIPGTPYVYSVQLSTPVIVFIHRWSGTGKHYLKGIELNNGNVFVFRNKMFEFHPESCEVTLLGGTRLDESRWVDHRASATQFVHCQSVTREGIPTTQDAIENQRRRYVRKQTKRLIENLPAGYKLLPNATVGYKIEDGLVHFVKPVTDYLIAKGHPPLKSSHAQLFGAVYYGGTKYLIAADGKSLYREGHEADTYKHATDLQSVRTFNELRPRDKLILKELLVWYEILPGAVPMVSFHWYVKDQERSTKRPIKDGLVCFRGTTFSVDSVGELTEFVL